MKRSPSLLLTILLFASIGAFAAGVKLFPDIASDMPLIPRGSGTLTDTLLSIIGKSNPNEIATSSGLVKNTQKLGGFSGSQYIRIDSACTDPLKPVWIGVNASGKPICGSKSSPGLVYLGTISEVGAGVSIYQSSGAIVTATVGMKVYNGDTIDTSATGKATVLFNDRSLLRLSANTTVTLDIGQYTGTSIASIILGRGDLWGRVLADNGQYDVGTSDIVAAVRGTSFALQKNNVSPPKPQYLSGAWNLNLSSGDPATFTLVDSVNPTNAVEIECLTSGTPNRVTSLDTTDSSNVITGCNTQSSVKKTPAQLYGASPWIRENTRADILYMFAIPDKTVKITNELATTEPTESEKAPLCLLYNGVDNGVWYEPEKRCVYAYADYTTGKDEMILASSAVTPIGWRYVDGLWYLREKITNYALNAGETGYRVYMRDAQKTVSGSFDTLWQRTSSSSDMSFQPNGAMLTASVPGIGSDAQGCMEIIGRNSGTNNESYCSTPSNWMYFASVQKDTGVNIIKTGQYIAYDPAEMGNLAGKTMQVKLKDPIPQSDNLTRYLADFGTYGIYFLGGQLYKKSFIPPTTTTSITFTSPIYTFTIDPSINSVVLGNIFMTNAYNLTQFINNTIQSVVIY